MHSKKSTNSFEKKKRRGNLIIHGTIFFFFGQFVNNFSALLLCKIYVFDFFNMVNFFLISIILRSTEIPIVLNFWLRVYM